MSGALEDPGSNLDKASYRRPAVAVELSDRTRERLAESVPPNTTRAYERAWGTFAKWCADRGADSLPAADSTLTEYASAMVDAEVAPRTISQHLGAIRTMHRLGGYRGEPDLSEPLALLRGYRRKRAENGKHDGQSLPILVPTLRSLVEVLDLSTVRGRRDRVLLLLGFAMMARRSELVALRVADVTRNDEGLEVAVRTSKTDKDSQGAVVAIPTGSHPELCPVRVTSAWIDEVGGGRLLRSVDRHGNLGPSLRPAAVHEVVQRLARDAQLDNAERYTAHSLRAGGLTAALKAGTPLGVAARHGRWSETSPVVIGYARAADRWRDNAMRGVL